MKCAFVKLPEGGSAFVCGSGRWAKKKKCCACDLPRASLECDGCDKPLCSSCATSRPALTDTFDLCPHCQASSPYEQLSLL